MGEVFSFGAEERASLLETLSQRDRPTWLRVVLHGDARALAPEIGLRVWQGRIVGATPTNLGPARVLVRMAFARAGRVEVRPDEGPEPDLRTALPIRRALLDAEQAARVLEALLAPLGGPAAVVVTRPDRVVRSAAQLGRSALALANLLLDRPRSVGDVLSRDADDLATARALDQLRDLGVLEVEGTAAAQPSIPPPASTASGRPGLRSRPPTMRSRAPARARARAGPPPADDDEPELARVLSEAPRVRAAPPPTSGPAPAPPAARAAAEPDPETTQRLTGDAAGPGTMPPPEVQVGPEVEPRRSRADRGRPAHPVADDLDEELPQSSATPWLAAMGLVIAILALLWWYGRTPEAPPPAPIAVLDPAPPPPSPTSSPTPTARTTSVAYSLSRPPPLAGPEADRRLREAERLIQQRRYDEAEAILAPLRASRAEDPLVWLLTGTLQIELGRFGEAATSIDKAIGLDPKSYRGYILRGSIHQFQGSGRAAVQSYRAALGISPTHPMSPELREVTERLEGDGD